MKPLARHMEESGTTLEQLVAASGLEAKLVKAIAAGNYTPSPTERQRLADALGVSIDDVAWGHAVPVDHLWGHGPQFGRTPQSEMIDAWIYSKLRGRTVDQGSFDAEWARDVAEVPTALSFPSVRAAGVATTATFSRKVQREQANSAHPFEIYSSEVAQHLFQEVLMQATTSSSPKKPSRIWPHLKSLASTLVFVWFFTHHIAQATMVPTESMKPTILVGDHFWLDKVAFPANYPKVVQQILPERTIHRSDIVAFWSPEVADLRLVKRVIGLPGDTFEIRDGDIYINNEKLDEPYVVHSLPLSFRVFQDMPPVVIPPDSFFMMGDNRDNSRDSRYFGFVSRQALIGRPLFVYWSYESDPQPDGGRTMGQWAEYYASVATHFLTRTRWSRTGTVLRQRDLAQKLARAEVPKEGL